MKAGELMNQLGHLLNTYNKILLSDFNIFTKTNKCYKLLDANYHASIMK